MAVDRVQAGAHRDHRDMTTTCLAPGIDLRCEVVYATGTNRHVFRAEVFDRPAEAAHAIAPPFLGVDGVVDAATEEDKAVREPGGPVERDFAESTKPDRDGPRRLRHE